MGLAHIATAEEIRTKGWRIPGKTVVVFQPPHEFARFKAYLSLALGAESWVNLHKTVAGTFPKMKYVNAANAGDCTGIAYMLKSYGYYTGDSGIYAISMISKKAEIDRTLGPAV